MLDPRAVATQGLSITPRLVAVNGLWFPPQPEPDAGSGGGIVRQTRKTPRKPHKDDDVLIFLL
jgi:hypothetical protein